MKFLIVDDEDQIRDGLEIILEDISDNIEFSFCGNAKEALDKYSDVKFDLIFCDLSMPIMNGEEYILHLRNSDGPNKETPVFLISAFIPKESPLLKLEDLRIIEKPFDMDNITDLVSKTLGI